MKNCLKELKPKVNKLYFFVCAKPSSILFKNKELSTALLKFVTKKTLPTPIRFFFQFPKFQEYLAYLQDDSDDPSPIRYETLEVQRLIEALHKLTHLHYEELKIKDHFVMAKLLIHNIQEYQQVVSLFLPYEGKIVKEILSFFFESIHHFTLSLEMTISNNPSSFSEMTHALVKNGILESLKNNPQSEISLYVASLLSRNPKLDRKKEELHQILYAECRKLINQMKTSLSAITQIPHDFESSFLLKKIDDQFKTECTIEGQKPHELFRFLFWKAEYRQIEEREKLVFEKIEAIFQRLSFIQGSLDHLNQDFHPLLPKLFCSYFNTPFSYASHRNSWQNDFTLGFLNAELEYLYELLDGYDPLSTSLSFELDSLTSFLTTYYKIHPSFSLTALKEKLENPLNLMIQDAFNLFNPLTDLPENFLISNLSSLLTSYQSLLEKLPPSSIEYRLLKEKLFFLRGIDFPSYPETWFLLGELAGVLSLLSSPRESFWHTVREKQHLIQLLFGQ